MPADLVVRAARLLPAADAETITDGALEVARQVRIRAKQGSDVVKIMATGGFMTAGSRPWEARYTEDELRACVQEAHRLGMPVTTHALADAGMSPRAVLAAATHRAAAALGLGSVTGQLVEGLSADAVAVRGDPTDDLVALHRPVQVIARGRAYECAIPSDADRAEQRLAAQHIHEELTPGSGRNR